LVLLLFGLRTVVEGAPTRRVIVLPVLASVFVRGL
jgi:hypothetical protein